MYTFCDVQTFHGRNWNAVVYKNNAKVRTGNNAELMDFAPDMMALLRDNNSRTQDKNTNACLQKHNPIGARAVCMQEETKDSTLTADQCIVAGAPPVTGYTGNHMELRVDNALLVVNGLTTVGRMTFNIINQITFSNFSKPDAQIRFVTTANGDCVVIVVVVVKLEG